jgi:hypothetical protein
MKNWKLASVVLVLVLLVTGSLIIASTYEPDQADQGFLLGVLVASLSEVSTAFNIPKADLEVAGLRVCNFGDDTFLLSSIVDKRSKQAYMVSTDEYGKVWIAEPKIEEELFEHMLQMKPYEETVYVSIWAIHIYPEEELQQMLSTKYPDVPFVGDRVALGANISPEVFAAIEADTDKIKLKAIEEAVQPVVDFLQLAAGPSYVGELAPVVSAYLSKEYIYLLARLHEVRDIRWMRE